MSAGSTRSEEAPFFTSAAQPQRRARPSAIMVVRIVNVLVFVVQFLRRVGALPNNEKAPHWAGLLVLWNYFNLNLLGIWINVG